MKRTPILADAHRAIRIRAATAKNRLFSTCLIETARWPGWLTDGNLKVREKRGLREEHGPDLLKK